MLSIDGSEGEGGGQILRTALASSLLTGVPFRIKNIRAGRGRPGLLHQHLAAVNAAAEVAAAKTKGATLGSTMLVFEPGEVRPADYHFAIGTAGSTGLLLQTVLVPLLTADGESQLVIEGGTHNEGAPAFEFLDLTFAPVLRRMGADLSLALERPGFYPAGGGRIRVRAGRASWAPLDLQDRGATRSVWARAVVSRLPISIAERELAVVGQSLGWPEENLTPDEVDADGPGNVLILAVENEQVTEVFTGFGRRGLPAEQVAAEAVARTRRYLDSGVAVDMHLADQLLVPFTQSNGGSFLTSQPTRHFMTNVKVLSRFFKLGIMTNQVGDNVMIDCRVG
ncbi:MAG: RNA 3'-terminal phosphate cyclase [Acidimicrobiia bacterium]